MRCDALRKYIQFLASINHKCLEYIQVSNTMQNPKQNHPNTKYPRDYICIDTWTNAHYLLQWNHCNIHTICIHFRQHKIDLDSQHKHTHTHSQERPIYRYAKIILNCLQFEVRVKRIHYKNSKSKYDEEYQVRY